MGRKLKCSVIVDRGTGRIREVGYSSRCNRDAVVVIKGEAYCWQHHPTKVKEREKLSRERSDIKWRSKQRQRERIREL